MPTKFLLRKAMNTTGLKVSLACDHAAVSLKNKIREWLQKNNIEVADHGTHSDASVDYPDYAQLVGNDVANGNAKFGILVCGSGIGMAIAANKIKSVRAATVWNTESTRLSREHNDANIMSIGTRMMDDATALECVKTFLETEFSGGRHCGRVNKIEQI